MFEDDAVRTSTKLRGKLAEVFFPALLGEERDALAIRLGERATLYHPLFGSATGLGAIRALLDRIGQWLSDGDATYVHHRMLVGTERDVAEGTLSMRADGHHIELPVAVVSDRRPAREIDVRVYHATRPFHRWQAGRPARPANEREPAPPPDVVSHLGALRMGDVESIASGFDSEGTVRDGLGRTYARAQSAGELPSKLHEYYAHLLQNEHGANDWLPIVRACADDGRVCAVEYETSKLRGDEGAPKEGLFVLERGDSGLLRSVRIYDEVGFDDTK